MWRQAAQILYCSLWSSGTILSASWRHCNISKIFSFLPERGSFWRLCSAGCRLARRTWWRHNRALSLSQIRALTTSPPVKRCGSLSALGIFRIFRPRKGLHRQSCSSVFHCFIFFFSFTAPKSENKRKTIIMQYSLKRFFFYFFLMRSLKA